MFEYWPQWVMAILLGIWYLSAWKQIRKTTNDSFVRIIAWFITTLILIGIVSVLQAGGYWKIF
jgi:ABC-type lipoprotein release transport system permease subunit